MTEAEWLACDDPKRMLEFIQEAASDRKLRLFAVGCCRRVWSKINWEKTRQAVLAAELYADGHLSKNDATAARRAAEVERESMVRKAGVMTDFALCWAAKGALFGLAHDPWAVHNAQHCSLEASDDYPAEWSAQSGMLRDIFGNPFRPVALRPEWRTATARALAQQMYDARDFSPMPILADALQDAGCADEAVLAHGRGPGPHVRGCWVVDALLNKV